jgi:DNA-binding NarL/FixJ family response regulator
VQSILEQTRVLRDRTIATRRQVQASASSRRAVRAAAGLRSQAQPEIVGRVPPALPAAQPSESPMQAVLTKRMREILELLVQGKSEKEVATHLGVSPHTVHIHVTRMYARLCVNSRAELLARFYRQQPARRAT